MKTSYLQLLKKKNTDLLFSFCGNITILIMTVVRDWQREGLKHYSHGAKISQSLWLW